MPRRFMNKRGKKSIRRPKRATGNGNTSVTKEVGRGLTSEDRSAWRAVKSLKGNNNKYIQTTYPAGVSLNLTTPYLQCLNAVAQGTSENARIGRLCHMKWLDLNWDVIMFASASSSTYLVRVYVIVETTCLGSALAPSQFLIDNANFAPVSQRDRTNRNASRYQVLYDSGLLVISYPRLANSANEYCIPFGTGQNAEHARAVHIPLNFDTDYSRGNAGTVADIDTNSLYLMVLTDDTNSNEVYYQGTFTVCFADD